MPGLNRVYNAFILYFSRNQGVRNKKTGELLTYLVLDICSLILSFILTNVWSGLIIGSFWYLDFVPKADHEYSVIHKTSISPSINHQIAFSKI
jgi:hypothetical protein